MMDALRAVDFFRLWIQGKLYMTSAMVCQIIAARSPFRIQRENFKKMFNPVCNAGSNHSTRSFLAVAFLMMLMFTGCATTRTPPAREWTCDTAADAAVAEGRWEQARSSHEALLLQDPGNCLAIYHLGYILGRLGMRAEEIDRYRQAIACGYRQDDQLYFNLGMALGDMDDMEGALAAFDRAVAINPRNAENHFGKGLMAWSSGHDAMAERAFLKVVTLSPGHVDAHLMLARLYLDESRWPDARRQLEAVLEREPGNPEALELWETMAARQREAYDVVDKP